MVKIHMTFTKFILDSYDLMWPKWILIDKSECLEKKYVLNSMLLSYKYNSVDNRNNNKGNANKLSIIKKKKTFLHESYRLFSFLNF